jgi:hypothetical protein
MGDGAIEDERIVSQLMPCETIKPEQRILDGQRDAGASNAP